MLTRTAVLKLGALGALGTTAVVATGCGTKGSKGDKITTTADSFVKRFDAEGNGDGRLEIKNEAAKAARQLGEHGVDGLLAFLGEADRKPKYKVDKNGFVEKTADGEWKTVHRPGQNDGHVTAGEVAAKLREYDSGIANNVDIFGQYDGHLMSWEWEDLNNHHYDQPVAEIIRNGSIPPDDIEWGAQPFS